MSISFITAKRLSCWRCYKRNCV